MLSAGPFLTACSGVQSALDPAGEEASQVATLFWTMVIGGTAIWASVVSLSLYASRWKRSPVSESVASRLIFWGGAVLPVAVLTGLLAYALWLMPSLRPFAGGVRADLRVEVVGHQFWWHVVYHRADGTSVASANEVRLPVGERVEFELKSADMIHSFWIPALGGKMDLIPGRTNRLSLLATKVGTYRGQCAEFCGTSHAHMAFPVVAMEAGDFASWLDARAKPSGGLESNDAQGLFAGQGCNACHRIAGTEAQGLGGPDLSHVGSRLTLGAGLLANDLDEMARFIAHANSVKPSARMPAYPNMSTEDRYRLAIWLTGLQ